MIVVIPDGLVAGGVRPVAWTRPSTGNFEQYVLPRRHSQVDATYRTIRLRAVRGVFGFYIGGFGS